MRFSFLILILSLIILFSSCATIRGNYQRVKLTSFPPYTNVLDDDEKVGTTPSFVYLRRGFLKTITLQKEGYKDLDYKLRTSYRWIDSFFSNLIFGMFAPIGWIVDLVSRAAWDIDPIDPKKFPKLSKLSKDTIDEPLKLKIAIAPPTYTYELFSNELGKKLFDELKLKYPNATIFPFEDTEVDFSIYNYTNKAPVLIDYQDDLYEKLNITHLAETSVRKNSVEVNADTNVVDIYTLDKENLKTTYPIATFNTLKGGTAIESLKSTVTLIPNSIAFDLIHNSNQNALHDKSGGEDYHANKESTIPKIKYLSGLTMRDIANTRTRPRFDASFRFSPKYSILYEKYKYERSTGGTLDDAKMTKLGFHAGIGPEMGAEIPIGYLYARFGIVSGIERITLSTSSKKGSSTGVPLNFDSELGYSFFISKNTNIHLFWGMNLWGLGVLGKAAEKVSSNTVTYNDKFTSIVGISLGYFTPEIKSYVKRLFY